ncbi:hypothetical protein FHS55_002077 [Angulomicrobium tetraedrale]|uniref:Uncharacterized protein n=1 Tax=Ancylobacter tetraedralis TaxID=217068 RepID=A0A839Z9S4_9HYPH|nr:hypothetical protein [Ancylobacter tetraedralis]MBB3771478.1 hypothetical protein [Ancylobacter tetraedralis]
MDMSSTGDGRMIRANAFSDEDLASHLVKRLEKKEAEGTGLNITAVRPLVARRVGLSPGTMENLRRGRIKAIKKHVYEWLLATVDRELASEIRKLETERAFLAAKAGRAPESEVRAVDASLQAARAALGEV